MLHDATYLMIFGLWKWSQNYCSVTVLWPVFTANVDSHEMLCELAEGLWVWINYEWIRCHMARNVSNQVGRTSPSIWSNTMSLLIPQTFDFWVASRLLSKAVGCTAFSKAPDNCDKPSRTKHLLVFIWILAGHKNMMIKYEDNIYVQANVCGCRT